jgi:phosphoesterase RecJ-like protein
MVQFGCRQAESGSRCRTAGGGGHENAAGCTLEGPLPRALDEILAELRPSVACFTGDAA